MFGLGDSRTPKHDALAALSRCVVDHVESVAVSAVNYAAIRGGVLDRDCFEASMLHDPATLETAHITAQADAAGHIVRPEWNPSADETKEDVQENILAARSDIVLESGRRDWTGRARASTGSGGIHHTGPAVSVAVPPVLQAASRWTGPSSGPAVLATGGSSASGANRIPDLEERGSEVRQAAGSATGHLPSTGSTAQVLGLNLAAHAQGQGMH